MVHEKLTPELLAVYSKAELTDAVMSLLNQVAKLTERNSQLTEQGTQLSEQLSLVTEQNARLQEPPVTCLPSIWRSRLSDM